MRRFSLITLAACSLTACGDADTTTEAPAEEAPAKADFVPEVSGKTDSVFQLTEAGRLVPGGTLEGTLEGYNLPVVRVLSHGNTVLDIQLEALEADTLDTFLRVEGPLGGEEEPKVVAYNDDLHSETYDSGLQVKLEAPGAYRVVVGSFGALALNTPETGDWKLTVQCESGCEMPQMTIEEVLADLRQKVGEQTLKVMLEDGAERWFEDEALAAVVKSQIDPLLAGELTDEAGTTIFPMVPLAAGGVLQGLFEPQETPAEIPGPRTFDLEELKAADCVVERPSLASASPVVPALKRGAMDDPTWSDCALHRAQAFADVLNNLALDNGSKVVAGDATYATIGEVFDALVASGHTIVAENNRYIANFLGFYYEKEGVNHTVVAPVWIDTGLQWADDADVVIPAPHSHYTFRVDGPLVTATIEFYMGTNGGTRFRAAATLDPVWVGERTHYSYTSKGEPEVVRALMQTAGALRQKWTKAAENLSSEGYAQLGVCNDSTAVLEYATEGTVSLFPLAQPGVTEAQDAIDEWLKALPSDLGLTLSDDALSRVIASWSFEPGEANPFPALSERMSAPTTAP